MQNILRSVLFTLVGLGACGNISNVFADQVILKNSDRLTGAIVKSDSKSLVVKTEYAGTITIDWAAIQEISSSQTLYVSSKKGQVLAGTLSTSDGRMNVETKEAGNVVLDKDAILSIRSEAEQKQNEARLERLEHPHLLDYWSGAIDSGLALARGNAETTTMNMGMVAARTTSVDKLGLYATSIFTKSRVTGNCPIPTGQTVAPTSCSVTSASALRGGSRYEFNLSKKIFAFGQLDLEHDRFQSLDLRTVLGAGLGYHAIKTARTSLDVEAGGSLDHENFSTGVGRTAEEVLLGEQLGYKVTKSTTLIESLQLFPNLSRTGEYRFNYDSGIVTQLSKWLSWQVSLSDRYLSNPIPGIKKNDVLITAGLHVTFGNKPL